LPVFAFLLGLSMASCSFETEPPPTTKAPLIYPDAEQIKSENTPGVESPGTIVTFQTNASPDEVLKFYKDTLLGEGWYQPIGEPMPGSIAFEWRQASINGPGHLAYRLSVFASKTSTVSDDPTSVEVHFLQFDPR
jgi:hypothetical protein